MTLRAWLDHRHPSPPGDLAETMRQALEREQRPRREQGRHVEALLDAATARLGDARSKTGRVRESAFELLAADALITYACEAALEGDDPDSALATLLAIGDAR